MENINIMDFIDPAVIILIPVLLGIGNILKGISKIKDEYIPIFLGVISVILSLGIFGISYDAILQGILVMLVTTGTHQLVKQGIVVNKGKEEDYINVSIDDSKNVDDLISNLKNDRTMIFEHSDEEYIEKRREEGGKYE